jgi:aerobic carbon-monoxide dehydrogenase medium subunit
VSAAAVDVVLPTSPDEAAKAFGDGTDVTIVGGGTIVMPEITHGRLRPTKVLMLARSGLDQVTRDGGTVTVGAAAPLSALEDLDEPLSTAARHVGDLEIRAQATVGGNICAAHSGEAPRGDLQAPLIVLGARIRSTGKGGEKVEPVEDFLVSGTHGRLVLDVSYDAVERKAGYAAASRPHAHHYTILAVAAAEANGELRVAATGLGPQAVRLSAVEQSRKAEDALKDAPDPPDDALASSWYRRTVLPKLVEQALADL